MPFREGSLKVEVCSLQICVDLGFLLLWLRGRSMLGFYFQSCLIPLGTTPLAYMLFIFKLALR